MIQSEIKGIDVFFFPGGKQSNPYIRLLEDALQKSGDDIRIFSNAIEELSPICFKKYIGRKTIIHLHWVPEFYPRLKIKLRWMYQLFSFLKYAKLFLQMVVITIMKYLKGAKVIWTVHNENVFHLRPFFTTIFGWWFSILTDAYIFHCRFNSYTPKPSFVIPHGNFIGIYGNQEIDRQKAKQIFGLPIDSTIFLILGNLRRSKQLNWLFEKFAALSEQNVRFFIAGEPLDKKTLQLCKLYTKDKRFIFLLRYIEDSEMPLLFAAADFLVNNQKRGYVSGITIAALSYGLPVIQLNWGCASSIIKHGINGFLFKDDIIQILKMAIETIKYDNNKYMRMRDNSKKIMEETELNWDSIAKKTLLVYKKI